MAAAVRRLAKAAGDQAALEQAYLAEMVACPAIVKAPAGWWNAHKTALTALARRDPEVGRTLLDMVPGYQRELSLQQIRDRFVQWLELLERSGATAALGDVTDRPRPSGGTAGWLDTVLEKWNRGIGGNARLPGLGAVVERVAGRLRDELAASGGTVRVPHDIDLLDLLLTLDVPVAGPDPGHRLDLDDWAAGDERRDLRALAADPRFTAAFAAPVGGFVYDQRNLRTVELLAETPGGRSLVLTWVRDVFRQAHAPGLPGLVTPHNLLEWLPTDILAAAVQDGPAGAPGGDLVAEIVRTLRGGLFGELCWPAFEEAVREVLAGSDRSAPTMQDAWPYLIVSGDTEVRVVGPEGTVLAHTFPDVPGSWISTWYVHYVDGALQVTWRDFKNHCLVGYWHVEGTPDAEPIPMTDIADRYGDVSLISGEWRRGLSPAMTLPLPGGGRTTGEAVLRPGDTRVPAENLVIGDGTSFWVRKSYPDRWVAYDPITGSQGAKGLPARLTSMAEKASGTVVPKHTWLRPAGDGRDHSAGDAGGRPARLAGHRAPGRVGARRGPRRALRHRRRPAAERLREVLPGRRALASRRRPAARAPPQQQRLRPRRPDRSGRGDDGPQRGAFRRGPAAPAAAGLLDDAAPPRPGRIGRAAQGRPRDRGGAVQGRRVRGRRPPRARPHADPADRR